MNRLTKNIRRTAAILACSVLIAGASMPSANAAAKPNMETSLTWAVNIANDNSHGYSQTNRQGPDYDCSSLVINALKKGGFSTGNASYTGNMMSELTKNGFTWIPWSQIGSVSNLKRGDILFYRTGNSGHTEFYLGNNKNVGAHGTYKHPEQGDQTGKEISVTNFSRGQWQGVFRYKGVSNKYFTVPSKKYTSIVDALRSIGADSSFAYRKQIAAKNSISNYTGTAAQNTTMLNKLYAGTLIKP